MLNLIQMPKFSYLMSYVVCRTIRLGYGLDISITPKAQHASIYSYKKRLCNDCSIDNNGKDYATFYMVGYIVDGKSYVVPWTDKNPKPMKLYDFRQTHNVRLRDIDLVEYIPDEIHHVTWLADLEDIESQDELKDLLTAEMDIPLTYWDVLRLRDDVLELIP